MIKYKEFWQQSSLYFFYYSEILSTFAMSKPNNHKSQIMKKIFFICFLGLITLTACNKKEVWEYKTISVGSDYLSDHSRPNVFDPTDDLNIEGLDGWELVGMYNITETVFPNFGNAEYHTGIKENTRTRKVNFVFKRRLTPRRSK